MDPNVARLTAKALQNMLLEKPHAKSPLYSNLRCSSAELLGRGFQLWEKYVDIPQVSSLLVVPVVLAAWKLSSVMLPICIVGTLRASAESVDEQ